MNYGFVKVAAAVPHVKVADCKFNVEKIESLIAVAEGKGVQIILFPEMSITGYTCGDLFSQQLLLEEAEMGLMQILNPPTGYHIHCRHARYRQFNGNQCSRNHPKRENIRCHRQNIPAQLQRVLRTALVYFRTSIKN